MAWDKQLWLELVKKSKEVSLLIPLWKKWAENEGIEYDNLENLIDQLPERNILFLLEAQEVFDVMKETIGFNQKYFLISVMGDQIRAWNHPKSMRIKRTIRKYWYKLFKPRLQRIYQIAYDNGDYKFALLGDPTFYDQIPRLISTATQFWTTNQIKKSEMDELAILKRKAVIDYADLGIKDISRKRDMKDRKVRTKYLLEHFKKFKSAEEYINDMENKYDVVIKVFKPYEEIIEILEKELEKEEKAIEDGRRFDRRYDKDVYIIGLVEKDSDFEDIQSMGEMMGISIMSAHGQNALASLEVMIKDLMKEGSKVILLTITDCDPTGHFISSAFALKQSVKLGIEPLIWVSSVFWNKLTSEKRKEEAYIPKQWAVKKNKKRTEPVQWWFDNIGYDINTDTFGGGRFGFELESVDDDVFREAVKDIFYAIGYDALAVLETLKDENREDVNDCCYDVARDWFDVQDSELLDKLNRVDKFKKAIRKPIQRILDELEDVKEEIIDNIVEQLEPKGEEISADEDFDDRDATKYVKDFEEDLLNGYTAWVAQNRSEIGNNTVLNDKLVKALKELEEELIDIDFDDFELPKIDKDKLIKELNEIVDGFQLEGDEIKDDKQEIDIDSLDTNELTKLVRETYMKVFDKLFYENTPRHQSFFGDLDGYLVNSKIMELKFDVDKIIKWVKDLSGIKDEIVDEIEDLDFDVGGTEVGTAKEYKEQCDDCKKLFEISELKEWNGSQLCEECFSNRIIGYGCCKCNLTFRKEDVVVDEHGHQYCKNCYELMNMCPECRKQKKDITWIINYKMVCKDCYDKLKNK